MTQSPHRLLNYSLVREIGREGMASVWYAENPVTQTDRLMGSPLYMSPEQITYPKSVDFRTDIYSLGVTLYALLAGKKPYDYAETSMFHIQTAIVHDPLPRLPNVSAAMNDVIRWATQKKATDRFADCTTFAQALTAQTTPGDDVTVVKSPTSRIRTPLSGEATVVRAGAPKRTTTLPTDEAMVLRPRPNQPASPAATASTVFSETTPTPALATSEVPLAAPTKNRWPLLAASVAGLLLVGFGSWFFWSGQTAARPAQPALVSSAPSTKSETNPELSRANGDLNRAISFYNKQRYDSALALFNRYQDSPVFAGNTEALTDFGIIHYYGAPDQGIPQNLALANEWLQKSVRQQNPKAYYYLSLLKDGVDFSSPAKSKAQDRDMQAVALYKQGAELGESYAQATLGELLLLRTPHVTAMDACQILGYLKQAADKAVDGASQNYATLKKSGRCTRYTP